jgi:uncharacterized protein YmfQ (DUF2313 family)
MSTRIQRSLSTLVAVALAGTTVMSGAQAAPISTEQVAHVAAASEVARSPEQARAQVLAAFERQDVQQQLVERGVSIDQARERVAAMTDDEAVAVARHIDTAPAGADVLGTIVFIFVLLLVTDILGFTKVFPFTRSIR